MNERPGPAGPVLEIRRAFQRALETRFVDCVEQATGRKVRAFMSQVHADPDIAAEIFVLEPLPSHPAPAGIG